ncbi:neuronal acetylcholine receptor subunit alpha-7-like [Convolutriloba macropyga]|uniref:neuronal acetylcholine receptor subunit alpha-7-like n=1 Tax=Convolutriloba macropyga TaxID=536237 RepID=UPI003F523DD4
MNQLWSNLTSNFQNFHPPAQLTNNTVYLFGDLFQILEVDERRGVIILKMFIYHFYHSEFAKWDPNMYNGTKLIMAQKGTFWDPPIVLRDSIDVIYETYNDQGVLHEGYIYSLYQFLTVKLSCSFDVSRFPFDRQYCPIVFNRLAGYNHDVDFYGDEMQLKLYMDNDEWDIVHPITTSRLDQVLSEDGNNRKINHELIIHLSIERKYLFYLLFLVFPNMILYLMSGLTFLLPAESGEKVSCAVTLFLAQVVSFGTLANIFPASSRNLPVLAYFVVIVTFHMGISCLLAIFSSGGSGCWCSLADMAVEASS